MAEIRTKTFKSGNSEAVRLPKEIAFGEGVELIAVRSGDMLTLTPAQDNSMAQMFDELSRLPGPDYIEERDVEEIPEREGL